MPYKKRLGFCGKCNSPISEDRRTCSECIRKQVDRNRERRQRYSKDGICRCGRKIEVDGAYACIACRRKHVKSVEKSVKKNIESGLCSCGREREPGFASCKACRGAARRREKIKRAKGVCVQCTKPAAPGMMLCEEHHNKNAIRTKANVREKRKLVLEKYGGTCVCCGESVYEFLTLDHKNNDGAKHREELKKAGKPRHASSMVDFAAANNFPDFLQILCWNCNCAKGFHGECPHEAKRRLELSITVPV